VLLRLIAAILGVLGLVAIALGIASATAWRADDTLTATAEAADGTTLVTTAPGLLEMGDPPVTIRASADDGSKVVIAIGRDTDVDGWVGSDPHSVITGLQDWHTVTVDEGEAEAAEEPADDAAPAEGTAPADPDGSDLWIDQATGEGEAELVWTPQDGRWTVLVAGVGEPAAAPTVELSWPQEVTTPWLLPGVIGGAVLLLIALLLFLRSRRAARPAAASTAGPDDVDGGATAARPEDRRGDATPAGPSSATRPPARPTDHTDGEEA
jgi:hypothetical protein